MNKIVVNNFGAFPYEIDGELKYSHEANLLITHRRILWGKGIGQSSILAENEDHCVYQLIKRSFKQYTIDANFTNQAQFYYTLILN